MASEKPQPSMVDDQYRGLLTDREREILRGDADVSENYRYRVVSRVRTKLEALEEDANILEKNHPKLYGELQDAVCTTDDTEEARDALRRALRDDAWGPVEDAAHYLGVETDE